MTLPLYAKCAAPSERPKDAHTGLWYDKFCSRWRKDGGAWTLASASGSESDSPKLQWIHTVTGSIGDERRIAEAGDRLLNLVDARRGRYWTFETESRFVTGLGRSHPVENGFAWHPTLGTPYLPGSSVKGMLRAWAEQPGAADVEDIFGPKGAGAAGSLIFFDALPLAPVKLEADVMTPHYHPWSPDDPPSDWRSPNPIPFLTVAAGAKFLFAAAPRNQEDDSIPDNLEEWLTEALQGAGAGAKTAVGYGRMRKIVDGRPAGRRERERLAGMGPAEREIEKILAEKRDGEGVDVALCRALEKNRIDDPQVRLAVARRARCEMEQRGLWRPESKKTGPKKARMRIRLILSILEPAKG